MFTCVYQEEKTSMNINNFFVKIYYNLINMNGTMSDYMHFIIEKLKILLI